MSGYVKGTGFGYVAAMLLLFAVFITLGGGTSQAQTRDDTGDKSAESQAQRAIDSGDAARAMGGSFNTNGSFNVTDSGNTTSNTSVQVQNQNCSAIVSQYNSAVSGSAVNTGKAAVAQTAARVNAPVSVVQSCVQGGSLPEAATSNGSDENGNGEDGTSVASSRVASDKTCPNPQETAALPQNTEQPFNFNVDESGTYQFAYDVKFEGDDPPDRLTIQFTDSENSNVFDPIKVTQDEQDQRIVQLDKGRYKINVVDAPDTATFTVTVSKCGEADANKDSSKTASDKDGTEETVIAASIPKKVLANTGGPTGAAVPLSAGLLPVGALLISSSFVAGLWLLRRSDR